MANSSGNVHAALSSNFLTKRPPRPLYGWINQNFLLVWMKSKVDTVNDSVWLNTIPKLQEIVNVIYTFTDVDEGIDFITEIKEKKVFLILSDVFRESITPVVHDIEQVNVIYFFCENETQHEQWRKVKNVSADITIICEELKQAVQECDQNSVSISLIPTSDQDSSQGLDQLDQSFMYTLLLKEILMTIEFNKEHVNDLITYYREQAIGNNIELKYVEELETEYFHHQPIWWYTYNYFLYSMVNRALRTMEVDLIIKMGFFVRDLYQNIVQLHGQQNTDGRETSLTVYRGQGLSQGDFERLRKAKDGLISFNNFLSTSCDRDVSLVFAESNQFNSNLIGVLFEIDIDPSTTSTSFVDISEISHYQTEKEYLFSMHSVFRIGQIEQIGANSRLWQVNLTLTSDRDPQLHAVTERLREETLPLEKGWFRLGNLLLIIGQLDKAQQLFEIILDQTSDDLEKANLYHMLGMVKKEKG